MGSLGANKAVIPPEPAVSWENSRFKKEVKDVLDRVTLKKGYRFEVADAYSIRVYNDTDQLLGTILEDGQSFIYRDLVNGGERGYGTIFGVIKYINNHNVGRR